MNISNTASLPVDGHKKSFIGRIKNWAKENITGTGEEKTGDYDVADISRDKVRIGLSTAGSGASFMAAAGKELLTGNGIPQDKLLHTGGTFGLTVALAALGIPPFLAASVTFVGATVGKEVIYDGILGKGCVDPRDVAANLCGSLAGYAAVKKLKLGVPEKK